MNHRVVAAIIAVVLVSVTAIVVANDHWHWWHEANLQAIWAEYPAWRYIIACGVVVALGYCLWVLTAFLDGRLLSRKTQHLRVIK